MKFKLIILLLSAVIFLSVQQKAEASELSVVINEVFPDPDGADAGKEWLELKNLSSNDINLKGYRLENVNLDSGGVRNISLNSDFIIPANSIGVIQETSIVQSGVSNLIVGSGKLNFYNTKAKVILYNEQNQILHEFIYTESKSGKSIESPGFPFCIKNVIDESGNSIGIENTNQLKICSDTLFGKLSYSTDGETYAQTIDKYIKSIFLKFIPDEAIGDFSVKTFRDNHEIQFPIEVVNETQIHLELKVIALITNLEYSFTTEFTIGKEKPKILFSTDNIIWEEAMNTTIRQGKLLYFKTMSNDSVTFENLNSPVTLLKSLGGSLIFKVFDEEVNVSSLNIKVIPKLEIESIYPAPKSGESESIRIKNISQYLFEGEIFLTDNIENKFQKKLFITLQPNESQEFNQVPSLNNSGDEIFLFYEEQLLDHVSYPSVLTGEILYRTPTKEFPVLMKTPEIPIPISKIIDVKKVSNNETVKLRGTITYKTNEYAYIQDESGGVKIVSNLDNLELGNSYEITGKTGSSSGEKKITISSEKLIENVSIKESELNITDLESQLGSMVFGEMTVLANFAKSFRIHEKVSISLTGFDGFDRTKGDAIRFNGILAKSGDGYKILPISLLVLDPTYENLSISYPIANFAEGQSLTEAISKIKADGLNSLKLALGFAGIYLLYRILKSKLDIIVLKFWLWKESRKTPPLHTSVKNTKLDTVNVNS